MRSIIGLVCTLVASVTISCVQHVSAQDQVFTDATSKRASSFLIIGQNSPGSQSTPQAGASSSASFAGSNVTNDNVLAGGVTNGPVSVSTGTVAPGAAGTLLTGTPTPTTGQVTTGTIAGGVNNVRPTATPASGFNNSNLRVNGVAQCGRCPQRCNTTEREVGCVEVRTRRSAICCTVFPEEVLRECSVLDDNG